MSEEKSEAKPRFTPEQMAEMKVKMLANYKDQIEFLKVQVEFEELSTRVIEAQARAARAETILAQIYGPGPEKPGEAKVETPKTETIMVQPEEGAPLESLTRKLKTD